MTPHASLIVVIGIPSLALLVLAALGLAIGHTSGQKRALVYALAATAWLAFTALLAESGFLAHTGGFPPRMLALLVPTLGLPVLLSFSPAGTALSKAPFALLVAFHAFRLPLELVMHQAAAEGTMPPQMTYTGSNFDIVTGVTALVVAGLALRNRAPLWLLWAWNTLGSMLLLAVLVIAIASLPAFAGYGRDPVHLNTWISYFPFVWLPAGLVSSALLGHLVLFRRLLTATSVERSSSVPSLR